MRPIVDFRVVIETPAVALGELATAKLINRGNMPIGFNVQAFTGARWIYVPENPLRGPVPKRVQILPAGSENRGCLRYLVSPGQPSGLFRFAAQATKRDDSGGLVAGFEVIAP